MDAIDKWADSYGHHMGNIYYPGFPWKVSLTVISYLVFVLKVGPAMMANRKPMELKWPMRVYNVINIIACSYVFLATFYASRGGVKTWHCLDFDQAQDPLWLYLTGGLGYCYLKIFDLLDTVFFILRKKHNQVTVLHVVHHAIMPLTTVFAAKVCWNSFIGAIVLLNSFVHVLMYTYYFLSSFGPEMQPYLWWKKHLTAIQLIQFTVLWFHSIYFIFFLQCPGAKVLPYLELFEATYFLIAFGKFYVNSYSSKPSLKSQ
ncbi:Elongation of very long chain fatty acids protein 1 [Halotydeus destructor]|nr:Elongation of very long chain fatty acids protein 1 [Halotydeus destructor]